MPCSDCSSLHGANPNSKKTIDLLLFYEEHFYGLSESDREKLCFIQFSTRMAVWPLLTFSIQLHNQLGYITHSIIMH